MTKAILLRSIRIMVLLSVVPNFIYAQSNPFKQENPSNMVDLFSGDFKYNIPVIQVPGPGGGYPIILNYTSGVKLNQEASCVGLGWSLITGGAIEREVVQYPDDSKGEALIIESNGENVNSLVAYNIRQDGNHYYSKRFTI